MVTIRMPTSEARTALEDIRSGMDDDALMRKYRLSPQGLQSLMDNLETLGLLTQVNAREAIKDITSGMNDQDFMVKHRLSAKGLHNLFRELIAAGIPNIDKTCVTKPPKRQVSITEITRDIRAKRDDLWLMEKYQLSATGLERVFKKLEKAKILTVEEIRGRSIQYDDTVNLWKPREFLRQYPVLSLSVVDAKTLNGVGRVIDLSEKGIGLIGIPATVDDFKTLLIGSGAFDEAEPMKLAAQCRWTNGEKSRKSVASGFEFTYVEENQLKQLRELIDSGTVLFDV